MSALTVGLKKTVNLSKTDFSMKANLPTAEPKMLANWEEDKLYHDSQSANGLGDQRV
jgi:isoleucyl-tRNA synthetase